MSTQKQPSEAEINAMASAAVVDTDLENIIAAQNAELEEIAAKQANEQKTKAANGIPELPWHLKPEPRLAGAASPYLDEYIAQASNASPMTPIEFHESAGLVLAATAIAGRIAMQTDFALIRPNLYVLWIAPTSVCRKSTALNFMEAIVNETFPHLLAPSEATPEAFLGMLAGDLPSNIDDLPYELQVELGKSRDFAAQRLVVRDELGGFMDSFARDYNSGLKQVWLNLWDCKDAKRQTKRDGLTWVRNPCMSLIGASTHMAMASHLQNNRTWEEGWWPRFGMLCATPDKREPEPARPSNTYQIRATVQQLDQRLNKPAWGEEPQQPTLCRWKKEQLDMWASFAGWTHTSIHDLDDERLHGVYSRMPVQALKVAIILASTDWAQNGSSEPAITTSHLHRAVQIVDGWRSAAHHLLGKASETARTRLQVSILRQISRAGRQGCTWTEVWKNHKSLDRNDVRQATTDLLEANEVTKTDPYADADQPKAPGRPKERFWAVGD